MEDKARKVLAAVGDMASRGTEWLRSYRDAHRTSTDEPVHDGNRRIYGVTDLAPQSTGFRAFNAFRLMIAPMIIRIIWLLGAYIAYPIGMLSLLNDISRSPFYSSGDMWKVVGVSVLGLLVFRLWLELLMAIFRIHESTTKTTELMGRLVQLEERQQSAAPEETGK